jgi:hypothetical protein
MLRGVARMMKIDEPTLLPLGLFLAVIGGLVVGALIARWTKR